MVFPLSDGLRDGWLVDTDKASTVSIFPLPLGCLQAKFPCHGNWDGVAGQRGTGFYKIHGPVCHRNLVTAGTFRLFLIRQDVMVIPAKVRASTKDFFTLSSVWST